MERSTTTRDTIEGRVKITKIHKNIGLPWLDSAYVYVYTNKYLYLYVYLRASQSLIDGPAIRRSGPGRSVPFCPAKNKLAQQQRGFF